MPGSVCRARRATRDREIAPSLIPSLFFTTYDEENAVMTPTVLELIDALRAHLNEFAVPAPRSVNLIADRDRPNVRLQLAVSCSDREIASALLAWADTLIDVTAEAWRPPDGEWVHLSVTGESPSGVSVHVYGYRPFAVGSIGTDLVPGAAAAIPLSALRRMATRDE